MKRSPLKRSTPLKNSSSLKRSPLKSASSLSRGSQLKCRRKTAKVSAGDYWSVFTEDLSVCYFTGEPSSDFDPVDIHHIFSGAYKVSSEKYGYVIPLKRSLHTLSSRSVHEMAPFSDFLKRVAEEEWLSSGRTKEEFIENFGRWY